MDNLLNALDSSLNVSFDKYDRYSEHPRFSKYKEKFTKSRQDERRKEFLVLQKQKKITCINLRRGLNEKNEVERIEKELMEVASTHQKKQRAYKDVLMMSEWLVDVPDDFMEKWIVVPCPVGKRVLVVAEKGTTIAYARKGFKVLPRFPSGLPGGCHGQNSKNCLTRLDCIWHESSSTLYVIDVLDFGPSLIDCECCFRFTWLNWKFDEYRESISSSDKHNRFKIVPLERFPSSELADYVSKPLSSQVKMDGLLFFHQEGLYEEFGRSPLVTWLKPYMVPDILSLQVHPDYLQDKPQEMETEVSHVSSTSSEIQQS